MTISEFPVQSKICVGEDGLYDSHTIFCLLFGNLFVITEGKNLKAPQNQ